MKKSVLILHQDSKMEELIKRVLLPECSEFNIGFAQNFQSFQNQVQTIKPAIIISGTLIHNTCCLSLIKQTRELLPSIIFVAFGDRSTTPCCQKCLTEGPDYFLDCPSDFTAIFKLLKHLSARSTIETKQIKTQENPTCEFPRYLISHPSLIHKNKILG